MFTAAYIFDTIHSAFSTRTLSSKFKVDILAVSIPMALGIPNIDQLAVH